MKTIFVYGTLKKGFSRNSVLREQRYLGIAKTEPKYAMCAYGGFPALVDEKLAEKSNLVADKAVYGELYEVDDACLIELDIIEGVDHGLFERKDVALDEITLVGLPTSQLAWDSINKKTACAYFFSRKLNGAADCSPIWLPK
jgi:gamma-glutamylcyclotransferase (GGCT)/AIG2-like uncharacterized protein YtfP